MNDASPIAELKRLLPQCLLKDQLRIGWRLARWLQDHRSAPHPPTALGHWLAEARASVAFRQQRAARLPAICYPSELPITAKRDDIVAAIRAHPVLVIAGETGSGKTTQLPKMCLEAGLGIRAKIGCTQPRRVAAVSLSRRLAEELDLDWGREVGCKIRFSDQTSPETYVKFMTDGVLLAEAQGDPLLSDYEVIIIDEAHERSLNIDFLLGLLKSLLAQRADLKLIITSATIDTQSFSRHFNAAPVIEVSGRMYPVEVDYAPLDTESEEQGDFTYVDAAVNAIENILLDRPRGDVLVFMPGERDILETRDAIQSRDLGSLEIVPLFGRLSAEDQQRVFAPCGRCKIVLATNIAETSLTVPGIRYVVDTGLARISRYNPRTRTQRLPIEPISQSSAQQRAGRCGRVAAGVCIRLFSETDFQARPPYTQPEIQRANLAEVILRMMAFKLGEIETFPFINPPTPAAIQAGYQLLQELDALDAQRNLTRTGQHLARLPIDPTIGRMILQAQHEDALREVLVIAAGLSIQDPRERPVEQQEAAASAHRRFAHPRSDFLTLLNIWEAYHDTWDSLKTQNQMRKFCKLHFLSYPRMREWRDIHAQLREALDDLGGLAENGRPASYAAIHRSILTGLWSQVAARKERNLYQLGGNRQAMIFPGSGLFERTAAKPVDSTQEDSDGKSVTKVVQPKWIVAGELAETSRLFVRTVAEIDPLWIVELAPHLCHRAFLEPHWAEESGRVLARERVTLNGLVVLERMVPYGKVNPAEATEIFIRSALVEEGLADHLLASRGNAFVTTKSEIRNQKERGQSCPPAARSPAPGRTRLSALLSAAAEIEQPDLSTIPAVYRFLDHNHQLRQKIELWQTRLRHRVVPDLDEALFQFYAPRLEKISSVPELNQLLRERQVTELQCLYMSPADLLGSHATDFDGDAFPDSVCVGDKGVPIRYAYAPGEDHDGVTVQLPFTLAMLIEPSSLDWAVPGLREPQILHLLQALPKALRRDLMPLAPKAKEMAQTVEPTGRAFLPALIDFIRRRYGVTVPASAWQTSLLPDHLRPRLEILGTDLKPVACGRDLSALRNQLERHDTTAETHAWQQAVLRWERYGLKEWNFDDLPDRVSIANVAGLDLLAFPALQIEEGELCLRLFRKKAESEKAHQQGAPSLLEKVLQRELAWLQKDLRALAKWRDLYVTLGPVEELEATAFDNLKQHLWGVRSDWPRTASSFAALLDEIRRRLPGLAPQLSEWIGEILKLRQAILLCRKPYPRMKADVDQLLPPQFLRHIPFTRLKHLPRYLKALLVRAERAAVSPAKDQDKLRRIQPYLQALEKLLLRKDLPPRAPEKLRDCRWLLEEYKVSLFAQELGTSEPVSPQKIERALAEVSSPANVSAESHHP